MTGETKTSSGRGEFMDHLLPVLTLLVIGYPLTLSTIRAMLVGWILVVIAITRSILRDYFQTTGSVTTVKTAPARSARRSLLVGVSRSESSPEGDESWITSWT
jgi:hypothetical protein